MDLCVFHSISKRKHQSCSVSTESPTNIYTFTHSCSPMQLCMSHRFCQKRAAQPRAFQLTRGGCMKLNLQPWFLLPLLAKFVVNK